MARPFRCKRKRARKTHEGEAELVLGHVLTDRVTLGVVVRALGEHRGDCKKKRTAPRKVSRRCRRCVIPFSPAPMLVDETPQHAQRARGEGGRQGDVRMHEWLRIRGSSVMGASNVRVMSESSSLPASSPPSTKRSLASVGAAPPLRTCWVCASKVAEVPGQTAGHFPERPSFRGGACSGKDLDRVTHGALPESLVLCDLGSAGVHLFLERLKVLDPLRRVADIVVGCLRCGRWSQSLATPSSKELHCAASPECSRLGDEIKEVGQETDRMRLKRAPRGRGRKSTSS